MNKPLAPNSADAWIMVGKVGRAFGIRGWLKIHSYTEPYTNLIAYRPWYLKQNGRWVPMTVTECKIHGNGLIAHFDGFDTPEQSQCLVCQTIGLPRTQLPALANNQYYWADLLGLRVYTQKNHYLGVIDRLFETGANDVIVIKNHHREILVPFVLDKIVLTIDVTTKIMIVDWEEE